ncbi:lanthionine synthetase C family protein [Kitasatospora sp. NPDC004614]|uniref:lanthionine synthetase C family protein n=1 Tax=unclassified Kitasatospora TaxID=2633591 RepID=UPI0036A5B907
MTVTAGVDPPWADQSLDNGAAGMALLHTERARTGESNWSQAHTWISRAIAYDVNASDSAGLFLGAPAIAFVLHAAAEPPERYQSARAELDRHVRTIAHRRADAGLARISAGQPTRFHEYDLLYGLTGIGALLLRTQPGSAALEHVLTYVVELTHPIQRHQERLPGWWAGHGFHWHDGAHHGPEHLNLGVAHGIAGPLLLLAQAARLGLTVPGHLEAILTITTWLDRWKQTGPTGTWWPETVDLSEISGGHPRQKQPGRPSWCYGTPGIARAGQLASIALDDTGRQHGYEQAIDDCLTDTEQLRRITDSGLCHGWAGLHQTVWHAAQDAANHDLAQHLAAIGEHLRQAPATGEGFLNGTAGTELALAAHTTNQPPASGWDTCLLIN